MLGTGALEAAQWGLILGTVTMNAGTRRTAVQDISDPPSNYKSAVIGQLRKRGQHEESDESSSHHEEIATKRQRNAYQRRASHPHQRSSSPFRSSSSPPPKSLSHHRSSRPKQGRHKAETTRQLRRTADRVRRGFPSNNSDDDFQLGRRWNVLLRSPERLTPAQRVARAIIWERARRLFQRLCGVPAGQSWPQTMEPRYEEDTGEQYYTPVFDEGVTHPVNQEIFDAVADILYSELMDPDTPREHELDHEDVYFNRLTIIGLLKKSFDGWKRDALKDRDLAKKQRWQKNISNSKRLERRRGECRRLLKVTSIYKQRHGRDPTPFVEIDWVSEMASEPEDGEDFDEWKERMGRLAGMPRDGPGMTQERWDSLTFWEEVRPAWRSNFHTSILEELRTDWWEQATPQDRRRFTAIRVTDTGRVSNTPPATAPWNCSISKAWWDEHAHDFRDHLHEWGTWGNPDGWDDIPDDNDGEDITDEDGLAQPDPLGESSPVHADLSDRASPAPISPGHVHDGSPIYDHCVPESRAASYTSGPPENEPPPPETRSREQHFLRRTPEHPPRGSQERSPAIMATHREHPVRSSQFLSRRRISSSGSEASHHSRHLSPHLAGEWSQVEPEDDSDRQLEDLRHDREPPRNPVVGTVSRPRTSPVVRIGSPTSSSPASSEDPSDDDELEYEDIWHR
ncbi:hypothetical protein OE88DRAFT_1733760 [Heliocybe sulcata]|uniref:Uncharacterized protein n=1 Tax=Heliocybe sulcata TaxID=5364 RepID=A0A5C3N7J2_9AGAM|nr:hypothetical protein OE88DRAFT_1733760 [Heliocybe sulcata]